MEKLMSVRRQVRTQKVGSADYLDLGRKRRKTNPSQRRRMSQ
jgi:hypothetical protein